MRKALALTAVILALLVAALATPVAAAACTGSTYVSGYYRSDGRYVSGYWRTCPDSSVYNNYSYYGNYNPYTGEYGTRRYSSSSLSTPRYRSYSSYDWGSSYRRNSWYSSWSNWGDDWD